MSEFTVSQGESQAPFQVVQSQTFDSQASHEKPTVSQPPTTFSLSQSTLSSQPQEVVSQSTQSNVLTYAPSSWSNTNEIASNPDPRELGVNISVGNDNGDDDDDDNEEEEEYEDDNDDAGERRGLRAIIEGDDTEILRRFGKECTAQTATQTLETPKTFITEPPAATAGSQPVVATKGQDSSMHGVLDAAAAAAATPAMPSFKVTPILQNIVATVNLGCPLDLRKITTAARNTEYNPQRFPALIMRIRDPKATALIFASGKVVCTGTKSEEMAKYAAKKFARIIQKIGFQVKFKGFKVQNIVASCDVKFPIRLEQLSQEVDRFSTYEPEIFPGLIFRMAEPRVSLLIFVSGKIVLSGAKSIADIRNAFNNIIPILRKYQKTL